MRYQILALVALLSLLMCVSVAEPQPQSQPPGKKKGPPDGGFKKGGKGGKGGRSLTVEEVVVHILAFDKDKVGKVTRDQLPERLQSLVDQGDTNKDGALDKDEIKALAAKLEKKSRFAGKGGKGGFGKGGFGKGPPKKCPE